MVRPKASSKKKQQHKGGIDFKKIKKKIGRKLPPAQNATNTEIKSKAIILPEQSVASEKAGLAVSRKGLTLKELLQHTSHHNAKVRKDALLGIRDLIINHPAELKLHKYAVIEKLRERISDDDKAVRDTLYQLFKSLILPGCTEDNQGPLVSLVMAYIFNAMTHLAIDVRLTAFKFLDLVVQHYPPAFSLHGEKILKSYEDILRKNNLYAQDKAKLKNALAGLLHCLSLLPCEEGKAAGPCEKNDVDGGILHGFQPDKPKDSAGICVVTGVPSHMDQVTMGRFAHLLEKLNDLVPVLVGCFQELNPLAHSTLVLDAQSFECLLSILQSIDFAVRFSIYGKNKLQSELQVSAFQNEGSDGVNSEKISPALTKKLLATFPLSSTDHLSEKEHDRYFVLNTVLAVIFLHLSELIWPPAFLWKRLLEFIERTLSGEIGNGMHSGKAFCDKYLISLLQFIPRLLSQVDSHQRAHLLEAFTKAFQSCHPMSSLKMACLSTIEEMIVPTSGAIFIDSSDPDLLNHQTIWIRELPLLLIHLGDTHPLSCQVLLHLQLRLGQHVLLHSSLAEEYDNMQYTLAEFYSTFVDGIVKYGPFIRLTKELQELSVCCLFYFSAIGLHLLGSLVTCCLCHELEHAVLFRIIEVLHSSYEAGHILIADYISFLTSVVLRFKVFPEELCPAKETDSKISNREIFKSVTSVVCTCLLRMGDQSIVLQMLEKVVVDNLSVGLPLDNTCALLRVLVTLDVRPTRLSEASISTLSTILPRYLVDVTSTIPEEADKTRCYYYIPCLFFFDKSHEGLRLVLRGMESLLMEGSHPSEAGNLDRVVAILLVILFMYKDARMQKILNLFKKDIDSVVERARILQMDKQVIETLEGRHKIKAAIDRLEIVRSAYCRATPTT